jgi:hypothetical protein
MVRNPTAALVAVLLLASPGFASAQSTRTPQRVFASPGFNGVFALPGFDGVPYPRDNERYCYLPSFALRQPTPHDELMLLVESAPAPSEY